MADACAKQASDLEKKVAQFVFLKKDISKKGGFESEVFCYKSIFVEGPPNLQHPRVEALLDPWRVTDRRTCAV